MVLATTAGCGQPVSRAPDPAGGTTGATAEQLERSVRAALGGASGLVVCADPATAGSALWECRVADGARTDGQTSAYRIRFNSEQCWHSVGGPAVKGCIKK